MDAIPNEIVLGDQRYFSIFNFCVWIWEGAYLILYAFINAVYFLVLSNLSLSSFVQALSTVYRFSDNNKMVLKKRKTWGVLVVKFMSEIRDNDIDVQYPPLWKAIPMIINHSTCPKCIYPGPGYFSLYRTHGPGEHLGNRLQCGFEIFLWCNISLCF